MNDSLDIDDASIVSECRRGDREAMSLLYSRHAPRMMRLISRYVSNADDAKDILHDGFIAAFTRLDTLNDPTKVDHWLATIMKNLSLKFLQEQSVVSILDEIPEGPGDDCDTDDIIDFETLEILISRLPDGYQKVFRLAVLENKSHKEIARILGIAPNSSSSQLFHAKVLLRRMIAEYKATGGTLALLLIAAVTGTFLYLRNPDMEKTSVPVSKKVIHPSEVPTLHASAVSETKQEIKASISKCQVVNGEYPSMPAENAGNASAGTTRDHAQTTDTIEEESIQSYPDSITHVRNGKLSHDEVMPEDNLFAYNPDRHDSGRGWSAGMSVDSGIFNFDFPSDNDLDDFGHVTDILYYQNHTNMLPISVGVNIEKRITSWLGIESGLTYTYLQTDFENRKFRTRCHWHYIGIPLKANLYAYSSSHIRIYGSVGGGIDIPAYSTAKILSKKEDSMYKDGNFSSPAVWSLGASIGISIPLSQKIDIYVEPALRYHFPHNCKVPNAWSDNPWNFSIPVGIRLKW